MLLIFYDEILEEQFGSDFQKLKVSHEDNKRGTLSLMNTGASYDLVKMSSKVVYVESLSWTIDSPTCPHLDLAQNTRNAKYGWLRGPYLRGPWAS